MAQTTKKTTAKRPPAKKSAPAKTVSRPAGRAVSSRSAAGNPSKRLSGAIACLFLSLFSFIGYFNVDAWFITYFCGFIKSLFGWGYYIFPPALLVCSCTLFLDKDKPVAFKTVSSFMTPFCLGAIYHLFSAGADTEFSKNTIKVLYESGKAMASGGVLSGIAAYGLKSAVSIYGAVPVFLIGFVFFSLSAVGMTVPRLISLFKKDRAYVDTVPAEPEKFRAAEPVQRNARQDIPEIRRVRRAIDIPLDDSPAEEAAVREETPAPRRAGFFNSKPRVKTPDQVLSQEIENTTASPVPDDNRSPMPTDNVKPLSIEEAAKVAGVTGAAVTQISSDSGKTQGTQSAIKKITPEEVEAETEEIAKTIEKSLDEGTEEYRFPPISLLKSGVKGTVDGREEVALNRERLESTIKSFGVSATITGVTRGPTVTRYDIELDQGVKLAKLTNLAGDLALSLGVASVRIAPIPDKISTVGIEVPNKIVSTVYLKDIIDSAAFRASQSKLTFALGEDISGNPIVGNIAKLPHLLIAGTTGSGKSVCMNSLILSLLYKSTPEEVRLIMIDPKMVELGIYNGIPHLFVPVVTDPKKAAGALQWAVVEMLKRYRLFSEIGVRDLTSYNAHQKSMGEPTIPRVVIVIDELADLMLVASKEVEESICRIAQMGRASGMHLVIATQRPSADVITGLMKANIPSRIAFAVSSAMESRIILDNSGAEKLIGAGDMLYAPLGVGKPMRIQGAFVSDEEREQVINFVKEGAKVEYREDILEQIERAAADEKSSSPEGEKSDMSEAGPDYDELLPQAVEIIFETKQASVSMLQRRLKLGYARAARIVDQMEEIGVVGPFEGSKPRQILITKQQWQEMQTTKSGSGSGTYSDQVSFSEYEDTPAEDWKD